MRTALVLVFMALPFVGDIIRLGELDKPRKPITPELWIIGFLMSVLYAVGLWYVVWGYK